MYTKIHKQYQPNMQHVRRYICTSKYVYRLICGNLRTCIGVHILYYSLNSRRQLHINITFQKTLLKVHFYNHTYVYISMYIQGCKKCIEKTTEITLKLIFILLPHVVTSKTVIFT